jgi:Cu-Zn family superoxide dismutase
MQRNPIRQGSTFLLLAMVIGVAILAGGASAATPKGLIASMTNATGATVGTVRFVPKDDGKVSVRVAATGLAPGFHGFHVHTAGQCDPAALDTAGNVSPFFTAGGHYNPDTTATHGGHAGDMVPLYVAADGTAGLRFTTDRFRIRDLMDTDGSAVIMHAGPDNLANIPGATSTGAERYHSHVDNVFGADTATKATGDAGSRFACGLVTRAAG